MLLFLHGLQIDIEGSREEPLWTYGQSCEYRAHSAISWCLESAGKTGVEARYQDRLSIKILKRQQTKRYNKGAADTSTLLLRSIMLCFKQACSVPAASWRIDYARLGVAWYRPAYVQDRSGVSPGALAILRKTL